MKYHLVSFTNFAFLESLRGCEFYCYMFAKRCVIKDMPDDALLMAKLCGSEIDETHELFYLNIKETNLRTNGLNHKTINIPGFCTHIYPETNDN